MLSVPPPRFSGFTPLSPPFSAGAGDLGAGRMMQSPAKGIAVLSVVPPVTQPSGNSAQQITMDLGNRPAGDGVAFPIDPVPPLFGGLIPGWPLVPPAKSVIFHMPHSPARRPRMCSVRRASIVRSVKSSSRSHGQRNERYALA